MASRVVSFRVPGSPELHVQRGGTHPSPPVLLVHGFSASSRLWTRAGWTSSLEDVGRSWIAPDLRGHGESGRVDLPAGYRTAELVNDLVRVLDTAGIAQADVIGYSLGGELALELAAAHPRRTRHLVVGGVGLRRPLDRVDTALLHDELVGGQVPPINTPGRRMWAAASRGRPTDSVTLASFLAGIGASGQVTGIAELENRVLFLAGTRDPITAGVRELAGQIHGAQVIDLEGDDHASAVFAPAARLAGIAWVGGELTLSP